MFASYFKIAFRNLARYKVYAILNISGLAIGIAASIIMVLYLQDQLTFDAFHAKAGRTYRLVETVRDADGTVRHFPFVMGPLGDALVQQLPNVAGSVRLRDAGGFGRFTVSYKDRRFYAGSYLVAGPQFFRVLDFTFLHGDPNTALNAPHSVVLTEAAAKKYFGDEDPMGKVLTVERFGDSKVTGLIKDPPDNSHLQFSMVFSLTTLEAIPGWKRYMDSWKSDRFITYIVTASAVNSSVINREIASILDEQKGSLHQGFVSIDAQPLRDIHFGSGDIEYDRNSGKRDLASVLVFAAIALVILLIACINYVNLATARAMKRTREIAMRKVTGAYQWQLVLQLLGESVLTAALSLAVAVILVELLLPGFNSLSGTKLALNLSGNPLILASLGVLALLVGILSGAYPAFYLARMKAVTMLKAPAGSRSATGTLRRALVVVQFALTIVMISATLVARRQLAYVAAKDLGFEQEHLLVVDINSGNTRRSFETIKAEMAKLPEVRSVSASSRVPGDWKNIDEVSVLPTGASAEEARTMNFICIDADFLRTFQIELLAGRNFSDASPADSSSVIVNETAARMLGWSQPLGKEIVIPANHFRARVIGVVRDFNFKSLHEAIGPLIMGHWQNPVTVIDYFTIRFRTADLGGMLASLEKIHRSFDAVTPMEYNFLDERIDRFYRNDRRAGEVFAVAATLAIAIAILGLLGLVSFVTEQRTKEIGVRKVLGATVPDILRLLWKEFAALIAAATVIGAPIAYLVLHSWLQDFAYRITISWWTFVSAGLFAFLITLLTVSVQTIRAATANPVEALRYE